MQITIEIPDNIAQQTPLGEADWLREIAIALFQQELITLGRASRIAQMNQIEFQQLLASRGICVHYEIEDLEADLQSLREEGW
ncbi:MAG: UPF0175 family protein [Geitlerinemataceae cyanobacterium]